MAEYLSKYTGQEIDQRLDKIGTIEQNVTTSFNTSNPNYQIYKFGQLQIETINATIASASVTDIVFPEAFPEKCIFVGVQGVQIHPAEGTGFSAPLSVQGQIVDRTQCKVFINNDLGVSLAATVIAIGY